MLACLNWACNKTKTESAAEAHYRIYVTNETSGNLSVIDGSTLEVVSTIPLGTRPRGIHPSPDGKVIYVALSGTPPNPPGTDPSTLPPADPSKDGIGIVDVKQGKLTRIIQAGSDPENFAVSKDGKTLYASNENAGTVSFIDVASGKPVESMETGEEPEGVSIAPNKPYIYVTSEEGGLVSVIDVDKREKVARIGVGKRPRSVQFLPDSPRAYVTAEGDGHDCRNRYSKQQECRNRFLGQSWGSTADGPHALSRCENALRQRRPGRSCLLRRHAFKPDEVLDGRWPSSVGDRFIARRNAAVYRQRTIGQYFRCGCGWPEAAEKDPRRRGSLGRGGAAVAERVGIVRGFAYFRYAIRELKNSLKA